MDTAASSTPRTVIYLAKMADPLIAPRLSRAVANLLSALAEAGGRPITWDAAVAAMLDGTDLAPVTVGKVISRAVVAGILERGGRWSRTADTRTVRLVAPWPADDRAVTR